MELLVHVDEAMVVYNEKVKQDIGVNSASVLIL